MSGLSSLINGLRHALIGTGGKGDLAQIVKDESRRLAKEIGQPPTRSQQKKLESKIGMDIGRVFMSPGNNNLEGPSKGSGVTWLYAGPNFLAGATDDRMLAGKVSMSGNAAEGILRLSRGKGFTLGPKYIDAGIIKQTGQHAMLSNRFIILKGAIKSLKAKLGARVGSRDASFMEVAKTLGDNSIPTKSSKHFPTGHSITMVGSLNTDSPTIVFGSDSKGVAGLKRKVEQSIKIREQKIRWRIKRLLSGYADSANLTGNVSSKVPPAQL
ncbi:MAG: hypothetical protein KGL39_21695 [Patescibacteria group bacterium]|nr:hypothetical protein [Patescibacteria group bacterium]